MSDISAEIVVAEAMRDCAKGIVARAESPDVVELATREWKRYSKRLADLEHEASRNGAESDPEPAASHG